MHKRRRPPSDDNDKQPTPPSDDNDVIEIVDDDDNDDDGTASRTPAVGHDDDDEHDNDNNDDVAPTDADNDNDTDNDNPPKSSAAIGHTNDGNDIEPDNNNDDDDDDDEEEEEEEDGVDNASTARASPAPSSTSVTEQVDDNDNGSDNDGATPLIAHHTHHGRTNAHIGGHIAGGNTGNNALVGTSLRRVTESADEVDDHHHEHDDDANDDNDNNDDDDDDDDDDDVVAVSPPRVTSVTRRSNTGQSSSKRHAIERVTSSSTHRLSNNPLQSKSGNNSNDDHDDTIIPSISQQRDSHSVIMAGTPYGLSQTLPLLPSPVSSSSLADHVSLTSVSLPRLSSLPAGGGTSVSVMASPLPLPSFQSPYNSTTNSNTPRHEQKRSDDNALSSISASPLSSLSSSSVPNGMNQYNDYGHHHHHHHMPSNDTNNMIYNSNNRALSLSSSHTHTHGHDHTIATAHRNASNGNGNVNDGTMVLFVERELQRQLEEVKGELRGSQTREKELKLRLEQQRDQHIEAAALSSTIETKDRSRLKYLYGEEAKLGAELVVKEDIISKLTSERDNERNIARNRLANEEKLASELKLLRSQSSAATHQIDQLTSRVKLYDDQITSLQQQIELQSSRLSAARIDANRADDAERALTRAKVTIQDLESKIEAHAHDADIIKSLRAAQLVNEDTSREYRLVCDDLRLAKAQIGNVELLKEQILSLEAKAERASHLVAENSTMKEELASLRATHDNWVTAISSLLPAVKSPRDITTSLQSLQRDNVESIAREGELQTNNRLLEAKLTDLQERYNILNNSSSDNASQLESVRRSLKEAESRIDFIRKDALSARLFVASFDKEDTESGHDTQRMKRISQLEDMLKEQTDKNALLTADHLLRLDEVERERALLTRQLQTLTAENESLQSRVGRGEFDRSNTRVLHFSGNHGQKVRDDRKDEELKRLQGENIRLIAALGDAERSLTSSSSSHAHISTSSVITGIPSINDGAPPLRVKIAELEEKLKKSQHDLEKEHKQYVRQNEFFTKVTATYRESVYMLTGFKLQLRAEPKESHVGNDGNANDESHLLTLRHIFAERADDDLQFRSKAGKLEIIPTSYLHRIKDTTLSLLRGGGTGGTIGGHQVPIFLAQITLDLADTVTRAH